MNTKISPQDLWASIIDLVTTTEIQVEDAVQIIAFDYSTEEKYELVQLMEAQIAQHQKESSKRIKI